MATWTTQREKNLFEQYIKPTLTPLNGIENERKTLQTLHKTLHYLCILLISRTLHCVGFEAKILHKPYTEPYMGTKSQRDKETKRGRVGEWERGRERKTRGRLRKTRGRLRKTRGRERKI